MIKYSKYLIYITIFLCSIGCKKNNYDSLTQNTNSYFPIAVGYWQTYQVSETIWDDFNNSIITKSYQTKELIESIVINPNGDTLYRLECYKRNNENNVWQLTDVHFIRKSFHCIERHEENLTFCKMIYPLQNNSSWNEYLKIDSALFYHTHYPNTNIINANVKKTDAIVQEFNTTKTINNQTFNNCINILLHEFSTHISEDTEREYYAKDIGLIYQYINHTEKKAVGGQFQIYRGFIREVQIIDYQR